MEMELGWGRLVTEMGQGLGGLETKMEAGLKARLKMEEGARLGGWAGNWAGKEGWSWGLVGFRTRFRAALGWLGLHHRTQRGA